MCATYNSRYRLGRAGEEKASLYFIQNGYLVLRKSYRTPYGEIDLIVQKNDMIVFVEVKTRSHTCNLGSALTLHQHKRACQTAELFLGESPDLEWSECRFDAILISQEGHFEHIQNIWEFG